MHAQRTRGCSITLPLSLTLVTVTCCIMHLLNATSLYVISGGLDYHEPTGTDPPVMSCSYSLTITIPAGSSAADGVVAIINDSIYEGPENFFLDLSVAQTFQDHEINEGSPLRATVEIEEDDGENKHFEVLSAQVHCYLLYSGNGRMPCPLCKNVAMSRLSATYSVVSVHFLLTTSFQIETSDSKDFVSM